MSPFPFTAIVGQEAMRMALLLNAVDPTVGGVLIAGQKGTGKTTAARAMATLLPSAGVVKGCPLRCDPQEPQSWCESCVSQFSNHAPPVDYRVAPFVELPLGATEDRVVGTLHVEEALRTGQRKFDPGLLAAAHRGVLYVDEVNLLDDHLVDLLLDAAATGRHNVEREGISLSHPSRFILIGTMNPEEGEVRPQLLDRFGTSVMVEGLAAPSDREQIVYRRLAFETTPEPFAAQWDGPQRRLASRIQSASTRLTSLVPSEAVINLCVRIATEAKVHGHRTELALLKASRALAALLQASAIEPRHVAESMRLVLRHRLPDIPMSAGDRVDEQLDRIERQVFDGEQGTALPDDEEDFNSLLEAMLVPGSAAAGGIYYSAEKKTLSNPSIPTR